MMADIVILAIRTDPARFATESVGISARVASLAPNANAIHNNAPQSAGEVVDGVGGQRNRPRHHHTITIWMSAVWPEQQADLDRTDPCRSGFQGVVDAVGGVSRRYGAKISLIIAGFTRE